MKKILLINSYSFDKIYQEWKDNISPGHYLFGKIDLDKLDDFKVDILPFEKYPILNKIGKLIKINFLDQQIRVLFVARKYDIIYAIFPLDNTRLLTLLKYLGLFKKPIVVLGHQNLYNPPAVGKKHRFKKTLLLQYEKIVFLSKELLYKTKADLELPQEIADLKFTNLSWGAEKAFYVGRDSSPKSEDCNFVICTGTTDRDFEMIIEVFRSINFPLEIYCTPTTRPNITDLPPHITINSNFIPYSDLAERYRKARIILIPIKKETINSGRTLGLTVLLDALAVGKPVVMTQNKFVDINPGDKGFGISIHSHNIEVWKQEISEIIFDNEKLNQMSLVAKNMFEVKYNSKMFADDLASVFNSL